MSSFVSDLVRCAVTQGGALAETVKFDEETGLMTLDVKVGKGGTTTQERTLCPAMLFEQYSAAANKPAFLASAIQTYVLAAAVMPAKWAEAAPLLRPRLQTRAYFASKGAALPAGATLPWAPLTPGTGDGELGVFVAAHFGTFAVVPVLSTDVERWSSQADFTGAIVEEAEASAREAVAGAQGWAEGADVASPAGGGVPHWDALLGVAAANLRTLSTEAKWQAHPAGCYQSGWGDGLDAVRTVLMPDLFLDDASVSLGRGAGGDVVATVATHGQSLLAVSQDPVSLCLLGDLTLDAKKAEGGGGTAAAPPPTAATAGGGGDAAAPAGSVALITCAPLRLVAVPASAEAGGGTFEGGGKEGGEACWEACWRREMPVLTVLEYQILAIGSCVCACVCVCVW